MTLTELFTGIANAIRAKTGSTATLVPTNFASAISGIQTGSNLKQAEGSLVSKSSFSANVTITLSGWSKIHHMYILPWYKADFSSQNLEGYYYAGFTAGDMNLGKGGSVSIHTLVSNLTSAKINPNKLAISFSSSSVLTITSPSAGAYNTDYYYYYLIVGE